MISPQHSLVLVKLFQFHKNDCSFRLLFSCVCTLFYLCLQGYFIAANNIKIPPMQGTNSAQEQAARERACNYMKFETGRNY